MGMFLIHPLFLVCSVILSLSYCFIVNGKKTIKLAIGLIPVFFAVSLLNPVFNTDGVKILFTYFAGRPYTWEALCYGMAIGAMFITIMLWFACYNKVMTSDKFMYIFSHMIPSVSLVLTMVLRLIPGYSRRLMQIYWARRCTGKSGEGMYMSKRLREGMTIVSALATWSLEGGVITADSMKSRGYGCGRRSSFSNYSFEVRDKIMFIFMAVLMSAVAVSCWLGAADVVYTPDIFISSLSSFESAVGMGSYCIFLFIPTGVNIMEAVKWRILKSKI